MFLLLYFLMRRISYALVPARAVEVAGDDKCISESVFIFALTLKLDPHPARIFRELPPHVRHYVKDFNIVP